jgi:hypothetical protein
MSYSVFCERKQKPLEEQIVKSVGNKFNKWDEIDSYMMNVIKAKSAYKFYGKNYGWALGYAKNSKSIISLYPLLNDFTIQMIIKKEHEKKIINIITDKEIIDYIKNKKESHEGKWIFLNYSKINSLASVKKMIDVKLNYF